MYYQDSCAVSTGTSKPEHVRRNLIMETVRLVSRAVIRSAFAEDLIRESCRALTGNGVYSSAGTALFTIDGKPVYGYRSVSGDPEQPDPVKAENIHLTRAGIRAYTKGVSVLSTRDFSRRGSREPEYEHTLIAPLVTGPYSYGLMSVTTAKGTAIGREEQQIIVNTAADMASGLERIFRTEKPEQNSSAEHETMFRQYLEDAPAGIAVIRDNRIVYANPRAADLLQPLPENALIYSLPAVHEYDLGNFTAAYKTFISNRTNSMYTTFRVTGKNRIGSTAPKGKHG
jgi:PAS domain-containing protein